MRRGTTDKHSRALLLLIITLAITALPSSRNIAMAHAVTWGTSSSLPFTASVDNIFPKLLQLQNGTAWLTWQISGLGVVLRSYNIYGTLGVWGDQVILVNSNPLIDDITPTMTQLDNVTILFVWVRGTMGTPFSYNLYTESYTNGKASNPTPLVVTPNVGT